MSAHQPEFSRMVKLSDLGDSPMVAEIAANDEECAALARRFDLPSIQSLEARYEIQAETDRIVFSGTLKSDLTQSCAISGEDFPVKISEEFSIAFVEMEEDKDEDKEEQEVELESGDCDILEYANDRIDIGEALAQTLYLALDPYPEGPNADKVRNSRKLKTEEEVGPFAALAELKDKLG